MDPEKFSDLMEQQRRLFEAWTNTLGKMGRNLPSVDAATREAWCRQAEAAKAALNEYARMMDGITQQISAAAASGPDRATMESALTAAALNIEAFLSTWGPQLQAMQDLAARWAAQRKDYRT